MNTRLFLKIFGEKGFESYFLDSFLECFKDGVERFDIPVIEDNLMLNKTQYRVEERLVDDGFLKSVFYRNKGYVITSKGLIHLSNGGYKRLLVESKLKYLSIWISLITFIISIWAFIRTF